MLELIQSLDLNVILTRVYQKEVVVVDTFTCMCKWFFLSMQSLWKSGLSNANYSSPFKGKVSVKALTWPLILPDIIIVPIHKYPLDTYLHALYFQIWHHTVGKEVFQQYKIYGQDEQQRNKQTKWISLLFVLSLYALGIKLSWSWVCFVFYLYFLIIVIRGFSSFQVILLY